MKYSDFKILFDRGKMWWNNIQGVFTALLAAIFVSKVDIWIKLISTVFPFVFIIVAGIIDKRLKLLEKEADVLAKRNPYLEDMNKKLDSILKQLNDN